jgi:AraC-like DNA-binding protein
MQPSLRKIQPGGETSFTLRKAIKNHFHTLWHYHPECEITIIEKSTGTCFAGDYIGSFRAGDIFLFGPYIPHFLRNDKKYFDKNSRLIAKATVIYFKEDLNGDNFLNMPEMKNIRDLLIKSRYGIMLPAKYSDSIRKKLTSIHKTEGFQRLILFISTLYEFSQRKEHVLLSSTPYVEIPNNINIERLNKASDYLMKYFQKKIYLKDLADIACMSPTAFCRYFRNHTGKTLFEFLNEIRIGHACRLLNESSKSISEICFESGFSSVTNFNVQFKKIKKLSPHEYQIIFR